MKQVCANCFTENVWIYPAIDRIECAHCYVPVEKDSPQWQALAEERAEQWGLADAAVNLVERLDRGYSGEIRTAWLECKDRSGDFIRPASERVLYLQLAKLLRRAGK